MRYPANVATLPSYLTMVRYKHEGFTTDKLRSPQDFQFKSSIGETISLPMPNNLSDGLSLQWDEEGDSSLVGKFIDNLSDKSATARAVKREGYMRTGTVKEKHTALLFGGVGTKKNTFSWTLTPETKQEADDIEKMVETFEISSLPSLKAGGELFSYPDMWKIRFGGKSKFRQMRFLPCVVTDISYNFSPNGLFLSYEDGNIPAIEISISFSEITSRNRETFKALR